MHYLKSTLILLFVLLSAIYLQFDLSNRVNIDNKSEETKARKLHELKMLADPETGTIPMAAQQREINFYNNYINPYQTASRDRSVTWNWRGPWNVGGRTRTLAIDVKDEKHLITGSVSGGIWQSHDGGITWSKVSEPNSHPGVVSISQDTRPGHTNIWYALSGELSGTSASGGAAFYLGDGAFISLDNGDTWNPIESTAGGVPGSFSTIFQGGWRIVCSPVDTVPACVYMALYGSIMRSVDTGKTWKAVLGSGNDSYYTDVEVTSAGIVYATLSSDGTTKGFYRSGDGVHFTNITPSFLKSYDRTVIGINPNNENEVYFLSELPSDTSGGVKTSNYEGTPEYVSLVKYTYINGDGSGSGGSWTKLSDNLPVSDSDPFDKFNVQGGYDLMVRVQPGTNYVYIGGTNLYRSTDGFTSSNNTSQIGGYALATTLPNFGVYPNHHPDQHDLYFVKSNPNKAYSISDGGVRYSENISAANVTWLDYSMGYITSQFYTVAIDHTKAYDTWVLGGLQDNGNYISYSNNPKDTWRMTINGDGAYNYIAPNREYAIISTQLGKVGKVLFDERGNALKRRRIDPSGFTKDNYNFINFLTMDVTGNHTLYMPIGKKLARLDNVKNIEVINNNEQLNNGWTISKDTITSANLNNSSGIFPAEITTLAISPSAKDMLYLGTSNREIYRVHDAKSPNPSFVKLSTTRLPAGGYVSGIDVDPDSAKNVLVCYSNYGLASLFFTNDSGKNWYLVGGNLENATSNTTGVGPSVRCVGILKHPNGKRTYFAGTSVGLYTTDSLVLGTASFNPTKWNQEGKTLIGANVVTDIRIRQLDGYVAIGTHGNGMFESYYFGNSQSPTQLPSPTSLQLYPNPASQQINFSFEAKNNEGIRAEITDISGRMVKLIFDDRFRTGHFTFKVDISFLNPGIYYLVIRREDNPKKVETQKLLIAR